MRAYLLRRIDTLERMGAALDERSLRSLRRWRWLSPVAGLFFIWLAIVDDRWSAVALFGSVGVFALVVTWPSTIIMLRGYADRDSIDTKGAPRLNMAGIAAGAAAGAALVPLIKLAEQSWPWW